MLTIFIDADACPVKDEVYRVARRYGVRVAVVANAPLRTPADPLVELVVRPGFGTADDLDAISVDDEPRAHHPATSLGQAMMLSWNPQKPSKSPLQNSTSSNPPSHPTSAPVSPT